MQMRDLASARLPRESACRAEPGGRFDETGNAGKFTAQLRRPVAVLPRRGPYEHSIE